MNAHRLLTLLATLLLGACSSVQLVYDNADRLILLYADDLLALREPQETAWRPLLDDGLAAHRARELPALVALLGDVETLAAGDADAARLACVREQARAAWRRSARLFAATLAPLLVTLDGEQIAHLRGELAERDEEYRDEHLDPDPGERHDARVERLVKRIEDWTGRLGAEQRRLVDDHVRTWPPLAEGWLDYRHERQERLFALLREGASAARVETFLGDWWAEQDGMPPALLAARGAVEDAMVRLFVELAADLGAEQRRHLRDHVGDLRAALAGLLSDDVRVAAAEGGACGSHG